MNKIPPLAALGRNDSRGDTRAVLGMTIKGALWMTKKKGSRSTE